MIVTKRYRWDEERKELVELPAPRSFAEEQEERDREEQEREARRIGPYL